MTLVNAQEHDVAIKSLLDALEKAGKATPILTGCEAGRGHVLRVKRRRLALVFVPGIMASRLTNGKQMIWDPDDTGVMKDFLGAGPAKRQAIMVNQTRLLPPPRHRKIPRQDSPYLFARSGAGLAHGELDLLRRSAARAGGMGHAAQSPGGHAFVRLRL